MFYNNPSISPPTNNMNQFSSLMEEDSNMNLLLSPFEPDHIQLGYAHGSSPTQPEHIQLGYAHDSSPTQPDHIQLGYAHDSSPTQPMIISNQNGNTDLYANSESSPIAMPNTMSKFNAATSSSSPQFDMCISRSPESSSSADSNLVSPPHQYYPTSASYQDFVWPETNVNNAPYNPTIQGPFQHNYHHNHHHSGLKRSASVPPHFQKFKPQIQDDPESQYTEHNYSKASRSRVSSSPVG
ncbi:hypothetical protein BD408DRAFT_97546 [Parasitella parasitica]|nr:hypothetical protein BD408DRAFT_97546 [Parasitella parasitica]